MSGDRPRPVRPSAEPPAPVQPIPTRGHGSSPAPPEPQTPDELAADVARQREELAETVEELQARLDVRTRMKGALTTADGSVRPELLVALGAGALAVVGLVVLSRVRSH